ncbi:MAG: ammonia-dependent NAD(+) synthetase [Promethearchaeota archaeon]
MESPNSLIRTSPKLLIDPIIEFIQSRMKEYNYKDAVIGISGGIDSAVAGKLVVEALGADRVFGILMPERDSAKITLSDSKLVCNFLGIKYKVKNLSGTLRKMGVYNLQPPAFFIPRSFQEKYVRKIRKSEPGDNFFNDLQNQGTKKYQEGQAYYRIKHRLRMLLLYFEAEQRHAAVIGCANKTEKLTG